MLFAIACRSKKATLMRPEFLWERACTRLILLCNALQSIAGEARSHNSQEREE